MKALVSAPLTLTTKAYGLRVTLKQNFCCVFVDEGNGWGEYPIILQSLVHTNHYSVGTVELSGYTCSIEELTVRQNETVISADQIYQNPVLDGYADPDVLLYEGTYYLYGTGGPGGYQRILRHGRMDGPDHRFRPADRSQRVDRSGGLQRPFGAV